ncbi:MAG: hypothetical protein P1U86_10620 [Verrucomicrobiales bacterium]|nr:hypothetical protein [Verrucomicrobiales bacterium]
MRPLFRFLNPVYILLFVLSSPVIAQNQKPYLMIAETTSPDGNYAVAWGNSEEMLDLTSPETLSKSLNSGSIVNYLVDLRNGNQVAVLDTSYFSHDDFSKNHSYLKATWRDDSKALMISENGKWETGSASVVFLVDQNDEWDPFSDVIPCIKAARRLIKGEIAKRYPDTAENYAITITPEQWIDDQSLLLNVFAEIPKSFEDDSFETSLKVTVPSPQTVQVATAAPSAPAIHTGGAEATITPNSVGPFKLGMTIQEAMEAMPSATFSRTSDGEGIALVLVQESGEDLVSLFAGEWDPDAPIDPARKIEFIDVYHSRFITSEGIHTGMRLSNIPASWGGLQEIVMSEIESREYARFTNQPSGIQLQVYGEGDNAGNYPPGNNLTATATPGARIGSIEVTGRQIMDDGSLGGIKLNTPQADLLNTAAAMNWGETFKGKDEIWEAFGQAVQTWMFPDAGASFDMLSDEIGGPKSVFSITVKAPSNLKTSLGIGIGDPKEKVLEAYREYSTSDEGLDGFFGDADAHLVGSIYGGMIFYFENGAVSEIFLGAAAE